MKRLWPFLFAVVFAVGFAPIHLRAQSFYLGLQVRPSVGAVFIEYVRFKEVEKDGKKETTSEIVETRLLHSGTAWAVKTTLNTSWWMTNAHVIGSEKYGGLKTVMDKQKRWWHPSGRIVLKTFDHKAYPVVQVVVDNVLDLAVFHVRVAARPLSVTTDERLQPGDRVVVVGHPMSLWSVVTEGRIVQESGQGFDDGDLGEILLNDCGNEDATPFNAHIFLFDALATFGSSGSPVVSMDTGSVVGVVRGMLSGCSILSIGSSYPYAIGGRDVLKFLEARFP